MTLPTHAQLLAPCERWLWLPTGRALLLERCAVLRTVRDGGDLPQEGRIQRVFRRVPRSITRRTPGMRVPSQRSSGAKQGCTDVSRCRARPRACVRARVRARYQYRSRSRTVGSAWPRSRATQAVTVVNPALCIRMIPRLQSASVVTWGRLRHGKWVDTIRCQCHTPRMRVMVSSCVIWGWFSIS
jgi:hypothetical protein